jgi:thermopsin
VPGTLTVETIRSTLAGKGVPTPDIHLPALTKEADRRGQPVSPTYSEAPAPMGVADLGLREAGGTLVGYVLNTTSVEGSITLTNAQSVYVDGDGPDTFAVELSSVLTNVTLFGNSSYQFWTQNFVTYTPSSGELAFGDNIWNFSSLEGEISTDAFYAHGPSGSLDAPIFYYAEGPRFTIQYPFTVTFYLNSTILLDRPALYFNYTLSNVTTTRSGSFDDVIFNSTARTPSGRAPLALFQINGEQYDPVGLINDLELTLVGNGDGATTTFYQVCAIATIAFWNESSASYDPVPSAANAGADTGETSDGVASYYLGNTLAAHLGPGPSFLNGLWNSTDPPGIRTMVLTLHPAAALVLVNPGLTRNASTAQWVPSSNTGVTTFYFPNSGAWYFDPVLSEYTPAPFSESNEGPNTTIVVTATLQPDTGLGIYTPMIVWGNGELATLAASGAGTAASPYVVYDNEAGPIDPEFAQWNDFLYPVFPGLLLIQTTAYVDVTAPPFSVVYPGWMTAEILHYGLPTSNHLQLEFWDVTHVALLYSVQIAGWLSAFLPDAFCPLGEVIFWNSSGNLIGGNTFYDQGSALALYGGDSNTIWGNTFVSSGTSASVPSDLLGGPANQTGVFEAESGDLLYNNYFSVPIPATTPTYDPTICQRVCLPEKYEDLWNVTPEPAAASSTVLGVALSGSIIGTTYQGGNYWSNYGTLRNPYGLLPYNDSGEIAHRGDYAPLLPFPLYDVTFRETGLPADVSWGVATLNATELTNSSSLEIEDPNGTYSYSVLPPRSGYLAARPESTFNLTGNDCVVTVAFEPTLPATFEEIGLSAGLLWNVSLDGTGTGNVALLQNSSSSSLTFSVVPGSYNFTIVSVGYNAAPATGTVLLGYEGVVTNVTFSVAPALRFSETGLPSGTAWSVALTEGGSTTEVTSLAGNLTFSAFEAWAGPYGFEVSSYGYDAAPASGSGSLPANANQSVAFTALPAILNVSVAPMVADTLYLNGVPTSSSSGSFELRLGPGSYAIELTAAGFETYFNGVTLTAGGTVNLSVTLVPVPTSSSSPSGVGVLGGKLIAVFGAAAGVFLLTTLFFWRRSRLPPAPPSTPTSWNYQPKPVSESKAPPSSGS